MNQLSEKNRLRESLRKELSLLNALRKETASLAACNFLIKHLEGSSFKVLSFASKPFEINLWPLNRWLMERNRLLLSKVEKNQLEIYEVNDVKNLKLSAFGIQEPCPLLCSKAKTDSDLLILVPALGFDENHHRIGHGKGHYDKFLPNFSLALKWGIGFEEQKCEPLPIESHDLALSEVFFF